MPRVHAGFLTTDQFNHPSYRGFLMNKDFPDLLAGTDYAQSRAEGNYRKSLNWLSHAAVLDDPDHRGDADNPVNLALISLIVEIARSGQDHLYHCGNYTDRHARELSCAIEAAALLRSRLNQPHARRIDAQIVAVDAHLNAINTHFARGTTRADTRFPTRPADADFLLENLIRIESIIADSEASVTVKARTFEANALHVDTMLANAQANVWGGPGGLLSCFSLWDTAAFFARAAKPLVEAMSKDPLNEHPVETLTMVTSIDNAIASLGKKDYIGSKRHLASAREMVFRMGFSVNRG